MTYLPKLRVPAFAAGAVLALLLGAGASAQTIGGPGGSCRSFGFTGGINNGSVSCRVSANSAMSANNTLYVVLTSPTGTPAQCTTRNGSGFGVTATTTTVPPPLGGTGCEFETTTGTVPSGARLGDIVLNLPSVVSGTALQFGTELCTDPTCVSVLSNQPVTATMSAGNTGFGCNNYQNFGSGYPISGYQGSNQFCGQSFGCGFGQSTAFSGTSCNGSTGFTLCNGTEIPVGTACTGSGFTLCNGTEIPAGSVCNFNSGFTFCNGVQIPVGSLCNGSTSGLTVCPNSQQVPIGSICSAFGTGGTVTYPSGWNLIGGPPGTTVSNGASPLYYLAPGSNGYQTLASGSTLQPGVGYWAYFSGGTTLSLPGGSNGTATVTLPAGQFITIGNPSDGPATVSGPAGLVVLIYTPGGGYRQTTQLAAGQGGFAALPTGGTITITGSGSGVGPFSPPPPPPSLP